MLYVYVLNGANPPLTMILPYTCVLLYIKKWSSLIHFRVLTFDVVIDSIEEEETYINVIRLWSSCFCEYIMPCNHKYTQSDGGDSGGDTSKMYSNFKITDLYIQ